MPNAENKKDQATEENTSFCTIIIFNTINYCGARVVAYDHNFSVLCFIHLTRETEKIKTRVGNIADIQIEQKRISWALEHRRCLQS
jgi:hypothetical protein